MKIYKIKRINDDLFSTGGSNPKWTKYGKTWVQLSHLKAHLTLIRESRYFLKVKSDPYENAVILIFDVVPENTIPIVNGEIIVHHNPLICKGKENA